jgi:hypothetical protein
MNDPDNLGLGELGQRVQAMSDPAPDSRLRPYQGGPASAVPASNGHSAPSLEPYEEIRTAEIRTAPYPQAPASASPASASPVSASQNAYSQQQFRAPVPVSTSASGPSSSAPSFSGPPSSSASFGSPAPPTVSASGHETLSPWETVPQPRREPSPAPQAPAQQASLPAGAPAVPTPSDAPKSGLHRALDAIRSTLPLVQKLLPLIDSNFATAVGALMAPHVHSAPPPPPPVVHIDMEPLERGLTEVRNGQRELRGQVQEQVTTLKRVEDQLERVREATDRNTLEQQELVEDLRSVGSRLGLFAVVGLVLLAISLVLNIYLIVQMQHILR